ncbi:hypothetical protein AGMMS49944_11660 [Spirochaetia bacterium]|nr:hypothetical protein AGMMS49944_11660 [Spirochaetia bacterium]
MNDTTFVILFRNAAGTDTEVTAHYGETILDAAKRANIPLDAPCEGKGSCGKCRVQVLSGKTEGKTAELISPGEYAEGYRLACNTTLVESVTVLIPENAGGHHHHHHDGGGGHSGHWGGGHGHGHGHHHHGHGR